MPAAKPLILASSSPRRIELLKNVGLDFKTWSPDIDENRIRGETPISMVKRLAERKASFVEGLLKGKEALVLAADTIVVLPGRNGQKRILGKPRDRKEAESMLRSISGRSHEVYTGYCLLESGVESRRKKRLRSVRTSVTMRKLSRKSILEYIKTGEPMDKAGAYAAQGLGSAFIEKIVGSYLNVVGLPISHVLDDLNQHFGYRKWN